MSSEDRTVIHHEAYVQPDLSTPIAKQERYSKLGGICLKPPRLFDHRVAHSFDLFSHFRHHGYRIDS